MFFLLRFGLFLPLEATFDSFAVRKELPVAFFG